MHEPRPIGPTRDTSLDTTFQTPCPAGALHQIGQLRDVPVAQGVLLALKCQGLKSRPGGY